MNRLEVLDAAGSAIAGPRQDDYGPPSENFQRIADMWTVILGPQLNGGASINATDVALMMAAVKLARLVATPSHTDSWVDLAGYAALGSELSVAKK
jgi:hypothetical protein